VVESTTLRSTANEFGRVPQPGLAQLSVATGATAGGERSIATVFEGGR